MCEYCGEGTSYLFNNRELGKYTDSYIGCEVGIYSSLISITAVGECYGNGSGCSTLVEY